MTRVAILACVVVVTGCSLFGPSFGEASDASERVHEAAVKSIEGVLNEPPTVVETSVDGGALPRSGWAGR